MSNAQIVERNSRGQAISHGQLYQLPAPRGLLADSWVCINRGGWDDYGQVIDCLDPEYDFRGKLLKAPHTMLVQNGGRVDIERCALYLVRGRALTVPSKHEPVYPTATI